MLGELQVAMEALSVQNGLWRKALITVTLRPCRAASHELRLKWMPVKDPRDLPPSTVHRCILVLADLISEAGRLGCRRTGLQNRACALLAGNMTWGPRLGIRVAHGTTIPDQQPSSHRVS